MKVDTAIEVIDISKKFKIYTDKGHTLKEKLLFSNRRSYEERIVLNGISFDVKKGEAVGLIGHNGCGKSTTLKLLTKIMYPDSGTIEMKGRVSSLIELGAGFHPDMSGRENIYINASIFGLARKEIDLRLEDIIAFSELEDFIDNPVRTYSSGMYMRLAFSVAINVDADILLIDEILAVGDAGFQAKCFNRLKEIKKEGTTIVIVSHSMGQIEQICDRSIWIHEGRIVGDGIPRDVNPEYLDYIGEERQQIAEKEIKRQESINKQQKDKEVDKMNQIEGEEKEKEPEKKIEENIEILENKRWGNGNAIVTEVKIYDSKGRKNTTFKTGEKIVIEINYDVKKKVKNAVFGIGLFSIDGVQCYGNNTRIDNLKEFDLDKSGVVKVEINRLDLLTGSYLLDVAIECDEGIPVDYFKSAYKFSIFSNKSDAGLFFISHKWNLEV